MSKIRLKGYSEEMHRKLLKELVSLNGRIGFRGYTKNDIVERSNGVLTYSPTNIVNNKIVNYKNDTYISQEKYIESPEIMVKNNDILFVKTGSTLGKSALVRNLTEPATINPQLIVIRTIHVDSDYLAVYLLTDSIQKQVFQVKIGGAVPTLTETEIGKFVVKLPPLREQTAIGSLFRNLDDLLASYKDNLANYQSLKATMLAKMFPKAGQTVPEIRLDGFEGEWEIKKFKSISTKRGKSNSKGYDYPAYSVSNQSGLIPQSEQFEGSRLENLEKTSYKIVEPNEFAYNPARINVGSIAFNDLDETVIVSSLYVIFSLDKSINNNYALLFIKSPEFNKEVRRNTEGSVREYLFYENFANIRIPIPPSLEEQQAISAYFSNLDSLIIAHQEKITQLETLKRKLLQDMFI
jgi:type I restriction-modification system specificty subunit